MKKVLRTNVLSAFRECNRSSRWTDYFYVNAYCQERLNAQLGLTSDCNETIVEEFTFRFDWNIQKWCAK